MNRRPELPLSRWDAVWPLVVAALYLSAATWQSGWPNRPLFDEVYHVRAAIELLAGAPPSEWTHPPLGKWLMAAGLWLWQASVDLASPGIDPRAAFAWRFPSAVAGAVAITLTYALGRSWFRSRAVGAVAAALLALDGVFFVQGRMGMLNQFELAFTLAGVLLAWRAARDRSPVALVFAACALGAAIATRWSALFAWALTLALLLATTSRGDRPGAWRVLVVATFTSVPALVYLAAYVPQLAAGAPAKLLWPETWARLALLQQQMYSYHATVNQPHPYHSSWWTWPLMLRPVWYFITEVPPHSLRGVWAIGNAFLWWATLPTLAAAAALAWRTRDGAWIWLAAYGSGLWLAWALQPRQETFMHYMLPVLPFVCLAVARGLVHLWHGPLARPLREQRLLAVAYGALVLGWFGLYFPLLTWQPITRAALATRMWLGTLWQ